MEDKLSVSAMSELFKIYHHFASQRYENTAMEQELWGLRFHAAFKYLSKCLDLKVVWVMRGWKRNNSQDSASCIYIEILIWLMSRSAIW